jgi:GT2 family glycosyltransferase
MERSAPILLGFVFTNFNSSKDTREAVKSIQSYIPKANYQIVVVDNGSNMASVEELKQIEREFDNITVILNNNIGYFKGLNVGIKFLKSKHPDMEYMVIGNNDLIFPEFFYVSVMHNLHLFEQYPVISPDIVTKNDFHQNPHVIKKISSIREIIYDLYFTNYYLAVLIGKLAKLTRKFTDRKDEEQFRIAQEIYQGHGSCYLIGPVFFRNFEELMSPTFLMYEEFFLSLQLHKKGMKKYYSPAIQVIHAGSSSIGQVPNKKIWEISKESHKEYRKYIKWNKDLKQ